MIKRILSKSSSVAYAAGKVPVFLAGLAVLVGLSFGVVRVAEANLPKASVIDAVVDSDGTGVRGKGFILNSSFRPDPTTRPGTYIVGFDRKVVNCAYVATIGRSDNQPETPGEIVTFNQGANDPNRISVRTFDSTGSESARAFHVEVAC